MKRLLSLILLAVCLTWVSGCGSGKEEDYAPEPINKGRPTNSDNKSQKDHPGRPQVIP
jgi:hypothetical protein